MRRRPMQCSPNRTPFVAGPGRPGSRLPGYRAGVRAAVLALLGAGLLLSTGCSRILNGPASAHDVVERPTAIMDFHALYTVNCAACHGEDGKGGPSIALNNPLYLADVPDDALRSYIAMGGPGSQMPGFSRAAGGLLTPDQINVIVHGIRTKWAKPAMFAGMTLPPYMASHPGDPAAGLLVYNQACARCHGEAQPDGSVPQAGRRGSIVDPTYLSLASDQGLRTVVIAGRPDLGMPSYQNDVQGQPLTDAQITDVVAWIGTHRPKDANPNMPPPQSVQASAAVSKAANAIDREETKAANNPASHDQGGAKPPSKAKRAEQEDKDGGMIRPEGL